MTSVFRAGAGSTGGITVTGISAEERAVLAVASLRGWFDASHGVENAGAGFRLRDRRQGEITLTPFRTPAAPVRELAVINGKPALKFGVATSNGELADLGGNALLPLAGDFSVAVVGKTVAGDNGVMFGNGVASASATYLMRRSDEKIEFRLGGSQLLITPSAYGAGAAFLALLSFEDAPGTVKLRVNGAETNSVTSALANANAEFHLGAVGAIGVQTGSVDNGWIAEALVFHAALGAAANAADLATVEGYLLGKYGL